MSDTGGPIDAAPTTAFRPTCVFIATGGTIAMAHAAGTGAPVPALSAAELLDAVPRLADIATLDVHELCNVPSVEMGPERWAALHALVAAAVERNDCCGVVISHGTDTIEETAWFLELTTVTDKPIVLVGAMRNASEPDADGPRNLVDAVRVCTSSAARLRGVQVVMNGRIHGARDVAKTHTSAVDAFSSGEAGVVGFVDDAGDTFMRAPGTCRSSGLAAVHAGDDWPRVDIVATFASGDAALIDAAVAAGAEGIVVQALGAGNVSQAMYAGIRRAIDRGVAVVIATRVPGGRAQPVYGFPGGGRTLRDAGALFAGTLNPPKARIMLMLGLRQRLPVDALARLFDCLVACRTHSIEEIT